ncbi:MAG: PAS domain S-box protein [Bacteroidia bacterium]
MKRVNTSISTITIISSLALTSLVFCFFGWMYYGRQKTQHFTELNSSLDRTSHQLSKGLSIAVWNFNENQVEGILESGMLDKDIDGISIEYNDQDKTIISILRDGGAQTKTVNKKISPLKDALVIQNDIRYDDDIVGKLTIYGTTRFVYRKLEKELTLIALFILLLIGIMMLGIYWILYLIVIKPAQALEKFSLSITAENLTHAEIDSSKYYREFENLGNSLQKMISSLNLSYKNLEESEKRFKDIANLLPMSVFELNLEGHFTFMNDTGFRQFDLTREEVEGGKRFSSTIHHDYLKTAFEARNLLAADAKRTSVEYKILQKNGTYLTMLFNAAPLFKNGVLAGFIGAGLDVTEQRATEAAINELLRLDFKKEQEAEKQKALALIEGQEKERLRISREVHDGVGQMMTAIKLASESIDPSSIQSKQNAEKFEYTKKLITEVITELRQISRDLSPTFLYDYGLFSAVNQLVNNLSSFSDVTIRLNSNIQKERFTLQVEITLYRIVQEVLNNAMKYSEAKNIKINLLLDAEFLELTVDDDGMGCDLQILRQLSPPKGNGLKNIISRANLIGANATIDSAPFRGFHISVQVPLDREEEPEL